MALYQGGYSNFAAKRAARHGRTKEYKASLEQNKKSSSTTKQVENSSSNKPTGPRDLKGHPKVMAYPSAKGLSENTGDSLLIKCFKYVVPDTGLNFEYEQRKAGKTGYSPYTGAKIEKGQIATDAQGNKINFPVKNSASLRNLGSSDRYNELGEDGQRKHKPLFYVELPIPQDVNDSNSVTWSDDNMNIFQLAGLAAVQSGLMNTQQTFETVSELFQSGIPDELLAGDMKEQLIRIISGKAINALGNNLNTNSVLGRSSGTILNSNLELLFNGVNLRTFPFSINFSPRNAGERDMVKFIIRAFKSSMAAKKRTEEAGQGGAFLSAPDIFSLEYRHGSETHPFLNSFKHCALTGMTVNYTQSGTYATYYDGTPVNMRMNLTFKELNPVYIEDYSDDVPGVGY